MKKMILALAVLLASTSSFAVVMADGINPQFSCRIPGMADGGYSVVVSTGGIAPHTEARLVESKIYGSSLIGNYVVTASKTPANDLVFADFYTRGQEFQLIVHGQPLAGAPVQAILRSNTKTGRFSVRLVCVRMLQSR